MKNRVTCPNKRKLLGLLHDTLSTREQTKWTEHLSDCPDCQRRLEALSGGLIVSGNLSRAQARLTEPTPELKRAMQRMQLVDGFSRSSGATAQLPKSAAMKNDHPNGWSGWLQGRKWAIAIGAILPLVVVGGFVIGLPPWRGDGHKGSSEQLNPASPSGGGFLLLGQNGAFEELADAVDSAKDGDVIVVRGNGPFETDPISLGGKSITIRAERGSHPVIRSRNSGSASTRALFRINASLVLEGLDIQGFGTAHQPDDLHMMPDEVLQDCSVAIDGGILRAANCRFDVGPGHGCIGISGGQCELRNCHLVAHRGIGLLFYTTTHAKLICKNSLVVAQAGIAALADSPRRDWNSRVIQLEYCTWATTSLIHLFDPGQSMTQALPTRDGTVNLIIKVQNNLVSTTTVMKLRPDAARAQRIEVPSADVTTLVRRGVDWRETINVYSMPKRFFAWTAQQGTVVIPNAPRNIEQWKRFWGQVDPLSAVGTIKFQSVGTPRDAEYYRIQSIHAGLENAGDKVGANVSLVGPGKPYAAWKQTEDYRSWHKAMHTE